MGRISEQQIRDFVNNGYVKVEGAIPPAICSEIRDILWKECKVDQHDPSTWTQPVIRLGDYSLPPFRVAAGMSVLTEYFDALVGPGKWLPRGSLGTFPVRFPSDRQPGDTGWHVDASFPGDRPEDVFSWRINVHSKGRALLMLFLFSDVGIEDAPTIVRNGSHKDVARILQPHGERGLTFMELAQELPNLKGSGDELATGAAGTVYLCHPFLAHAAQAHRGRSPKFMAQPPLILKEPFSLAGELRKAYPVEKAIVDALAE